MKMAQEWGGKGWSLAGATLAFDHLKPFHVFAKKKKYPGPAWRLRKEVAPLPATIKYTDMLSSIVEYFWQQGWILLVPQLPPSSSVCNKINKRVLFEKRGLNFVRLRGHWTHAHHFPSHLTNIGSVLEKRSRIFENYVIELYFIFVQSSLLSEWIACVYQTWYMGWLQMRPGLSCKDLGTHHHCKLCTH